MVPTTAVLHALFACYDKPFRVLGHRLFTEEHEDRARFPKSCFSHSITHRLRGGM